MATLERVTVKIYPMNEQSNPYIVTFEHTAPNFVSAKLLDRIVQLLREEFIAEGAEHINFIR
jgi:hypothetical protein